LDVIFGNRHISDLYEKGKSRKYPLQKPVLKKFSMRIQQMEAAVTIHDLWKSASLNFEKLKGSKNRYSVRIDKKWRLEFEIDWQNNDQTVGVIYIEDITKHYGD